mgnify:CR=1 FL=1
MALDRIKRKLLVEKQARTSSKKTQGTSLSSVEGNHGDIAVRITPSGPRLFAKAGNKWYSAGLLTPQEADTEVKMQYFSGRLTNTTADFNYQLPDSLKGRVSSVLFFANHSGSYYHIYEWKDIDTTADSSDFAEFNITNAQNLEISATKHRVLYNSQTNQINVSNRGTQIGTSKGFKVIVFYI